MITLSGYEQFAIGLGISLLTYLKTRIKNKWEEDACTAAISFLQDLVAGNIASK
jgi:hypothetical protein